MKECVDRFISVITHNVDSEDLDNFYCNIKDLKIKKLRFCGNPLSCTMTVGTYDVIKNEIKLYDGCVTDLYHELMHMASARYEDGYRYEGFATNCYEDSNCEYIGYGLNEGYTELLTRKYFDIKDNETDVSDGYDYLVYLARLIEMIIGEEKMKHYYFNADLSGVISELSKYVPKCVGEELICDLDYLHSIFDKKGFIKKINTIKTIRKIKRTLFLIFSKKLSIAYKNNQITKEVFFKRLLAFQDLIIDDVNNSLDGLCDNDLTICLNESMENEDKTIVQEYVLARKKFIDNN